MDLAAALPAFPALLLQTSPGWAGWIIQWVIHPLILIGVPLVSLGIMVIIVAHAFDEPGDIGPRSLAAALLPFVALMFVFVFQASLFSDLASHGGMLGFVVSLVLGLVVPFLARLDEDLATPLSAFCFAAVFSVLVFSYAAVRDARVFVFYYGFTLGALTHVAVFGLPARRARLQVSDNFETGRRTGK
jgi:hypothetical protein